MNRAPLGPVTQTPSSASSSSGAAGMPGDNGRTSSGLRHFFQCFPEGKHLEVLDLGGLNETNVNFLSALDCRIHTLDLLAVFDQARAAVNGRFEPEDARAFVEEYLGFPPAHFDAALAWDTLEHLDEAVIELAVSRLGQVLQPGGSLLAFFHSQAGGENVPLQRYEISDRETLAIRPVGSRRLPRTFNNRSLERLFGGFESVKFFLSRDSLREVIAVR